MEICAAINYCAYLPVRSDLKNQKSNLSRFEPFFPNKKIFSDLTPEQKCDYFGGLYRLAEKYWKEIPEEERKQLRIDI